MHDFLSHSFINFKSFQNNFHTSLCNNNQNLDPTPSDHFQTRLISYQHNSNLLPIKCNVKKKYLNKCERREPLESNIPMKPSNDRSRGIRLGYPLILPFSSKTLNTNLDKK